MILIMLELSNNMVSIASQDIVDAHNQIITQGEK
jgi:hypothetical protein